MSKKIIYCHMQFLQHKIIIFVEKALITSVHVQYIHVRTQLAHSRFLDARARALSHVVTAYRFDCMLGVVGVGGAENANGKSW